MVYPCNGIAFDLKSEGNFDPVIAWMTFKGIMLSEKAGHKKTSVLYDPTCMRYLE